MRTVLIIIALGAALIIYDLIFNLSPELDRNMKIEIGVEKIDVPNDVGDIFPNLP